MAKRALLVGIDRYKNAPNLINSVLDATAMKQVLERHDDGTFNYDCRLFSTFPGPTVLTRDFLRQQAAKLFQNSPDDILFYFSGHGASSEDGGSLMAFDGTDLDPGLSMKELIDLANNSRAREVLLILDCCFSGSLSNKPSNTVNKHFVESLTDLREGITVLAASHPNEPAIDSIDGQGAFTSLVIDALKGGGADVRGNVSSTSIYSYVEQALGPWQQRPLYKSNVAHLSPIRRCKPIVDDQLLRKLPHFFELSSSQYKIDTSYEYNHPSANKAHIEIFEIFTKYHNARLLTTVGGNDLYYTMLESGTVELTPLGRLYWRLAKEGRI